MPEIFFAHGRMMGLGIFRFELIDKFTAINIGEVEMNFRKVCHLAVDLFKNCGLGMLLWSNMVWAQSEYTFQYSLEIQGQQRFNNGSHWEDTVTIKQFGGDQKTFSTEADAAGNYFMPSGSFTGTYKGRSYFQGSVELIEFAVRLGIRAKGTNSNFVYYDSMNEGEIFKYNLPVSRLAEGVVEMNIGVSRAGVPPNTIFADPVGAITVKNLSDPLRRGYLWIEWPKNYDPRLKAYRIAYKENAGSTTDLTPEGCPGGVEVSPNQESIFLLGRPTAVYSFRVCSINAANNLPTVGVVKNVASTVSDTVTFNNRIPDDLNPTFESTLGINYYGRYGLNYMEKWFHRAPQRTIFPLWSYITKAGRVFDWGPLTTVAPAKADPSDDSLKIFFGGDYATESGITNLSFNPRVWGVYDAHKMMLTGVRYDNPIDHTLLAFDRLYRFTSPSDFATFSQNYMNKGLQEKWIRCELCDTKWAIITPNHAIHTAYDERVNNSYWLVKTLALYDANSIDLYSDPNRIGMSVERHLDKFVKFIDPVNGNLFRNAYGRNEIWFKSASELNTYWYYMLPNGALFRWDSLDKSLLSDTQIGFFSPFLYTNVRTLLLNATP
jgi:hypothetical protein